MGTIPEAKQHYIQMSSRLLKEMQSTYLTVSRHSCTGASGILNPTSNTPLISNEEDKQAKSEFCPSNSKKKEQPVVKVNLSKNYNDKSTLDDNNFKHPSNVTGDNFFTNEEDKYGYCVPLTQSSDPRLVAIHEVIDLRPLSNPCTPPTSLLLKPTRHGTSSRGRPLPEPPSAFNGDEYEQCNDSDTIIKLQGTSDDHRLHGKDRLARILLAIVIIIVLLGFSLVLVQYFFLRAHNDMEDDKGVYNASSTPAIPGFSKVFQKNSTSASLVHMNNFIRSPTSQSIPRNRSTTPPALCDNGYKVVCVIERRASSNDSIVECPCEDLQRTSLLHQYKSCLLQHGYLAGINYFNVCTYCTKEVNTTVCAAPITGQFIQW